jgi:DNA-binding LacI/PurR family transcriptional regulator
MPEDQDKFSEQDGSTNRPHQVLSSPPTSMDVARLAKVSRATVSYVLNDVPDARISEETRKRVLQAAAKLGYVPHQIASSLRSGHSDLVLLPFFDWPYNQSSITFLQQLALQLDHKGYTVMFRFFSRRDKESLARKIAAFHPIGVIVVSEELTQADVEILSRNGVQAILAYGGASTTNSIPSIAVDFTSVGECVGEYFIGKDHRHIAAIVPRDARILQLGLQRLEGLERIGRQTGVKVERVDLGYDTDEAARLAARWKRTPRPTGVFTYNDEYGLLLMSALQDVEINIPSDIALIGCDDLPLCEMLRPRLTSVNIAPDFPARDIANYFDQMIQGQDPNFPSLIPLACNIIVRESSWAAHRDHVTPGG